MKKGKIYYAVSSNDGVGIYDDVIKKNRILKCLSEFPDTEVCKCQSIEAAKSVAICNYNQIQLLENNSAILLSVDTWLPMNSFLFKREIEKRGGGQCY